MDLASEARKTLQERGVKTLLRESKRGVSRRLFGRKTFVPYRFYFEYHTFRNRLLNQIKYTVPPDPYRPIYVNPTTVQYRTTTVKERDGLGQVISGKWDKEEKLRSLEEHATVKGIKQRFAEGKDWDDTVYASNRGKFDSKDEFLNVRCRFVDQLYQSIKEEGYRPNYEAEHIVPKEEKNRTKVRRYRHELEPLVAIGRTGEIYWVEGFHRLAISRVLSMDSIPVQVVARHKQWQQLREKVHTAIKNGTCQKIGADLRTHPDLQDLYQE